ncbi:MAG: L-threonylcarbamoyladenylate synthase [Mesorhizobium sp.]
MARIVDETQALDLAVGEIDAGRLVALPTETVYGLAADATNGAAVASIYETKGRPRFNPLIVHVDGWELAQRVGTFDRLSRRLGEAFWPGPLTIVVPLAAGSPVHPLVAAGLDTVAVRMPRGFARDLIGRLGRPIAAPSANSSGRISGTSAQAVEADLGGRIGLIVDGGQTRVGVESTIIRIDGDTITLLRPGGVTAEDIEKVAGVPVARRKHDAAVVAPGMLASHYAPAAAMRLDVMEVRPGEALLAFGPVRAAGAGTASHALNLSAAGDLREAAANLFAHMQALDASGAATIAVEPVPHEGLGEAINDRLARAAAPRDSAAAST